MSSPMQQALLMVSGSGGPTTWDPATVNNATLSNGNLRDQSLAVLLLALKRATGSYTDDTTGKLQTQLHAPSVASFMATLIGIEKPPVAVNVNGSVNTSNR